MAEPLQYYPSMHPKGERPSGKGRFLCFDTEWVGLLNSIRYNNPKDQHCLCVEDIFSNETFWFFDPYEERPEPKEHLEADGTQDGYLWDGFQFLMEAEALVIQNGVGFDFLAYEKAYPKQFRYNHLERRGKDRERVGYFPVRTMDTMLISQLLNPDRKAPGQAFAMGRGDVGPHSIEAHGIRIGRYKPENEDWSKLTDHMLVRCSEDAAIGKDFFFWLMNNEWSEQVRRGRNPRSGLGIDSAYRMELQTALAIGRQGQRGFRLDMPRALQDFREIDKEMEETFKLISPHIPPRVGTEPLKQKHLTDRVKAFEKAFPGADSSFLRQLYQNQLMNTEARIGERATKWKLTMVNGDYTKAVKEDYPEMVGCQHDTKSPLVAGPYTPLKWEEIGLGGLEYIKENVLYPRGWRGVNFSETDEKWMDNREENPDGLPPSPWSGKIDEASLAAWEERDGNIPEWLKGIVKWYVLRSRRSQILNPGDVEHFKEHGEWPKQANGRNECRGLMARAYNKALGIEAQDFYAKFGEWPTDPEEEWRVPAAAFSIGTNTFRMRHKFVVNIPSRGHRPLRHLFIAGNGKKILGCDGAGLELRMLAHFMADAIYQEIVLNGDIHTHNQLMAGLAKRDTAKTFIYAFLYGSGIKNLAKVCGMTEQEMELCVAKFKRELPALAALIKGCEEAGRKNGYLHAIDGRWGRIRRQNGQILVHTVLNVLLQMTGSLCMKYGLCLAENQMIEEQVALDEDGWPAFVANVHDEIQMEVPEDEVEYYAYTLKYELLDGEDERKAIKRVWSAEEKREHLDEQGRMWSAPHLVSAEAGTISVSRTYHRAGHILASTMTKAGELLRLRCPLAGEYKIGDSWHDTH